MKSFHLFRLLIRCALWLLLLSPSYTSLQAAPPAQSPTPSSPLQLQATPDGLQIFWQNLNNTTAILSELETWPRVEIGGYRMPAQLVSVRIPDDASFAPRLLQLDAIVWPGSLTPTENKIPVHLAADGKREARPDLAERAPRTPPTSPIVVLREGRLRGSRLIVVAVTPIFERNGALQIARRLQAVLPAAQLAEPAQLMRTLTSVAPKQPAPQSPTLIHAGTPPTNPAALTTAWTITVSHSGIQVVTGTMLQAAGLNLSADPALLRLRRNGAEIPLELRTNLTNTLSASDELRFYAPPPGDRWNASDTYWLTIEATPGLRMPTRSTLPGSAPLVTTALERGVWRNNVIYDSTLAGADGDHWFAAELKTGSGLDPAILQVPLTPSLPLVAGTTILTVTGSSVSNSAHQLKAQIGAASDIQTWSGTSTFTQTFTLAASTISATLTSLPGTALVEFIELDAVYWERPISLNLGGNGAIFSGFANAQRYQVSNAPLTRTLYDVTNPLSPTRLTIPSGAAFEFEDGPSHLYLLSGNGVQFNPPVQSHAPINLATQLNTPLLYIAPSSLHNALAPLVVHRQAQGYAASIITPQAIYDGWSYGQVSPTAIREFLRFAANWSIPPIAVTLVGDGTMDPLNYRGANAPNLVPPYLLPVDTYIGETACDTCYAQLDYDDPLADPLPDLLIGRLPVKNAADLTVLVNKIIGYETAPKNLWQARNIYLADNYQQSDGRIDGAGNFAYFADVSIAQQPLGIDIQRLYYDPCQNPTTPPHPACYNTPAPWLEKDGAKARARSISLLNAGAGLINYNGHGDYYHLGVTDILATPPYLLSGDDSNNDIGALTNSNRLPIVLEMSCLTSAFHRLTADHMTIDERFLLNPNGGAVAVWGSSGLGVAHGHDALQRGFYLELWQSTAPIMGQLTARGYHELFTTAGCCFDTIQTFILLGDPMMRSRIFAAKPIFLPLIRR